MAMTMNGEVQLAAPREAVWAKLNEPGSAQGRIPGCEELERTEDNGFPCRGQNEGRSGPRPASRAG